MRTILGKGEGRYHPIGISLGIESGGGNSLPHCTGGELGNKYFWGEIPVRKEALGLWPEWGPNGLWIKSPRREECRVPLIKIKEKKRGLFPS